jgi:hypothetical protein
LQADEAIHEQYHAEVVDKCKKYLDDERVEGFLFNYVHFWGDYEHYQSAHGWYPREIRIIRNKKDIHSWKSAQSFRRIPDFDYLNYRVKEGTYKLNVIKLDAYIYHYGWVRPPKLMTKKNASLNKIHSNQVKDDVFLNPQLFDYGPMKKVPVFYGTHPKVMADWINSMDWKDHLNYTKKHRPGALQHKHDRFKNKAISWVENNILNGRKIFTTKNYILVK